MLLSPSGVALVLFYLPELPTAEALGLRVEAVAENVTKAERHYVLRLHAALHAEGASADRGSLVIHSAHVYGFTHGFSAKARDRSTID